MDSIHNLIYFNNNRSTSAGTAVLEAITAFSEKSAEERASTQQAAWDAALAKVGGLIGAESGEMAFAGGASEAIALSIEMLYKALQTKGNHIITSVAEHPSVLNACTALKEQGAEITLLGIDREGLTDPAELRASMRPGTVLVCLMAANNETGVMLPFEAIAEICKESDVLFFSDASQLVGKERCDAKLQGFDCMAFGSHKMYGPAGIGAIYVSAEAMAGNKLLADAFEALKRRCHPGTLDAGLALGFGVAAETAQNDYWDTSAHLSRLRNYVEHQLLDLEGLRINGSMRHRLCNTTNMQLPPGFNIERLMAKYAFAANRKTPSHVLAALGLSEEENRRSCRFSFGKYNTAQEVKLLVEDIMRIAQQDTEAAGDGAAEK